MIALVELSFVAKEGGWLMGSLISITSISFKLAPVSCGLNMALSAKLAMIWRFSFPLPALTTPMLRPFLSLIWIALRAAIILPPVSWWPPGILIPIVAETAIPGSVALVRWGTVVAAGVRVSMALFVVLLVSLTLAMMA